MCTVSIAVFHLNPGWPIWPFDFFFSNLQIITTSTLCPRKSKVLFIFMKTFLFNDEMWKRQKLMLPPHLNYVATLPCEILKFECKSEKLLKSDHVCQSYRKMKVPYSFSGARCTFSNEYRHYGGFC